MRFRITWDGVAYRVSIPNYEGGEVITAEVTDAMVDRAYAAFLPSDDEDWLYTSVRRRMRRALEVALTEHDEVAA